MKSLLMGTALLFLTGALPSFGANPSPADEAHWATKVADDFFAAISQERWEVAAALLSPEFDRQVSRDTSAGNYLRGAVHTFVSGRKAHHASPEISPDGTEVVLHGLLVEKGKTADFTMRLVKERTGRWTVRYFLFSEKTK